MKIYLFMNTNIKIVIPRNQASMTHNAQGSSSRTPILESCLLEHPGDGSSQRIDSLDNYGLRELESVYGHKIAVWMVIIKEKVWNQMVILSILHSIIYNKSHCSELRILLYDRKLKLGLDPITLTARKVA